MLSENASKVKVQPTRGTKIVQIETICIILSLVLINNFDITFSQR